MKRAIRKRAVELSVTDSELVRLAVEKVLPDDYRSAAQDDA